MYEIRIFGKTKHTMEFETKEEMDEVYIKIGNNLSQGYIVTGNTIINFKYVYFIEKSD